ncbi:DCL family protein [Streptosporangium sp. NBC_01469]|uniref:DCL family protein n=1 Tax=Streptosporangium sp. NBC_01469 TaxID=2903898 RepID=UPI002E28510F|nr:DCL family protein [Streptosporangium sp. NBC_01469]
MPACWIGDREYRSKAQARAAVQAILRDHSPGTELTGEQFSLIRDLLDMHPRAEAKIGPGVADIRIVALPLGGHHGFELIRTDGTPMDFSYQGCLDHPSPRTKAHNAMRFEVEELKSAYFEERYEAGTFTSDASGVPLRRDDTDVSYFQGPSFAQIADDFAELEGGWSQIPLTPAEQKGRTALADHAQADRWRARWKERAVLGLLRRAENNSSGQHI